MAKIPNRVDLNRRNHLKQELETCRQAFESGASLAALHAALMNSHFLACNETIGGPTPKDKANVSISVPRWVVDAMLDWMTVEISSSLRKLNGTRSNKSKAHEFRKRYESDMRDLIRARAVEQCRRNGSKWTVRTYGSGKQIYQTAEIYEDAHRLLEHNGCKGSPGAIAKSYTRAKSAGRSPRGATTRALTCGTTL